MLDNRPWKLVAPWYYWKRQIDERVAANPRGTRPAFQKFDQPDFVDGFLKNPQRSLRFKSDVDQVFTVNLVPAPPLSTGVFSGRSVTFFAPKTGPGGAPNPQKANLVPSGVRKLYLDTHRRYYLVVCELHCDSAGLPTVTSDQVCQAGFVIRRRLLKYAKSAQKEALAILREIVGIEAQIAELDQTAPLKPAAAAKRAAMVQKMVADGSFSTKRSALSDQLSTGRAKLQQWKDDNGVLSIQEGWVPGRFDRIGQWEIVEDTPHTLVESSFPLYRLFANPDLPDHDAKGKAIYFGIVPTSSLDTDETGKARFDDKSNYEIRCFTRRHKPECPRRADAPDCPGELFWSEPTEFYRLASQFDLEGTSNRPVTIQVPSLAELAAQAANKPFGRFSPVRFVKPQALKPKISGMSLGGGAMGGAAICFFAIPLITLVALFVLELFLPIVVLIFGLWFLLVFKFCIPPSFSIDAGIQAELTAIAPRLDTEIDVSFTVNVPGLGIRDQTQINVDLQNGLSSGIAKTEGVDPPSFSQFANSPLRALATSLVAESKLPASADDQLPVGLDLTGGLEYEARVTATVSVT